jgi:lipoprotein signal peptidase
VPNPLVRGDVAFNLADVAIAVGVALLVGGSLLHGWANRSRLREPV